MDDQFFSCGLDDFIQTTVGVIQYIHFSKEDEIFFQEKETIFSIESEKWTGHFVAPFDLHIIKRNTQLLKEPSLINKDCYGLGWVVQVRLAPDSQQQIHNLFHKEEIVTWINKESNVEKNSFETF